MSRIPYEENTNTIKHEYNVYEPTVQLARNECILPPPYYNYLQPESHEIITTAEEVCDHAYVRV